MGDEIVTAAGFMRLWCTRIEGEMLKLSVRWTHSSELLVIFICRWSVWAADNRILVLKGNGKRWPRKTASGY